MSTIPVRPQLRDDLVSRQVDDDLIIYDPVSDRTLLLNNAAKAVGQLCNGKHTLEEITAVMAQTYGGDERRLRLHVEAIVRRFDRHGLLRSSVDGPGPAGGNRGRRRSGREP